MTATEEYLSLRQEIMDDQGRRETAIALVMSAAAVLLAAGLNSGEPLVILTVLPLLFVAQVQITHIHFGIQRIAAYIRVMHEEENPDLNWETASYIMRSYSISREPSVTTQRGKGKVPDDQKEKIRQVSSKVAIENLLLIMGIIAGIIALYKSSDLVDFYFYVTVLAVLLWFIAMLFYRFRWSSSKQMDLEDLEADIFRQLFRPGNEQSAETTELPPDVIDQ